jgi:hypothetical protein
MRIAESGNCEGSVAVALGGVGQLGQSVIDETVEYRFFSEMISRDRPVEKRGCSLGAGCWLAIALLLVTMEARAEEDALTWTNGEALTVQGRGWVERNSPFARLPAKSEELVRSEVWGLSRDSAGLHVDFVAETSRVAVRWDLTRERLQMPHMPASGASGLDLYVWDDEGARWRWLANGRPGAVVGNERVLVRNLPVAERRYRLYLPLYNGIATLEIGTEGAARAAKVNGEKPIVIYGTSIVQGASAMRPGMAYPAQLGRRLGRPVLNLGFSGNGRGEPEVAALLAELDPAIFVLDPLPNMSGPKITPLVEEFIAILRQSHPETPIVLVESIVYANAYLVPAREERHSDSSRQMRELWERLSQNDPHLHLVRADRLLGEDGEDTVDGTHPTDLGFYRIAEGLYPILAELLKWGSVFEE